MDRELQESFGCLNSYQKKAVESVDRALLLNASVGSGKTTVLVSKVLYLYHVKKVPLSSMVVLTFTNKAAEEIKDRVISTSSSPIDTDDMRFFGTFHGVARNLLVNCLPIESLGYTRDFTIVDSDGLEEICESIINSSGLDIKYRKRLQKRIERLKDGDTLYGNMKRDDEIEKLVKILAEEKLKRNVMDFDDLIKNCTILLEAEDFNPSWVIIDEFQDTDSSQMDMIDVLAGDDTRIFAVGDPNQIIYSWRGSREDIFETFKDRYNAVEMTLPVNYRSTGTILEAAKAFLKNPSSLEGIRDKGNPIVIKRHYDAFNEALYLADLIKKLHDGGTPYKDIGIFYRVQKQSAVFEDVFERKGIPYEVSVRKNLRDIPPLYWFVRVLKGSVNNRDRDSFIYVVQDVKYGLGFTPMQSRKAFGKKSIETGSIPKIAKRMMDFNEWCSGLGSTDGLEDKIYEYFDLDTYLSPTSISYFEDRGRILKYLSEIKKYIVGMGYGILEGIKNAVNDSMLYGRQIIDDIIDPEKESVKLMTLHASKGLEFKYVFITGANYGIIPLGGRMDNEEEKRLFFVALTRAKDYLEISYHSNPEGYNVLPEPSPFIGMIPKNLITSDVVGDNHHKLSQLKAKIKENMELERQDKKIKRKIVNHPKYGQGYVVSEDDEIITARFEGYGEKSFSKLFCPLKFIN